MLTLREICSVGGRCVAATWRGKWFCSLVRALFWSRARDEMRRGGEARGACGGFVARPRAKGFVQHETKSASQRALHQVLAEAGMRARIAGTALVPSRPPER